jgi:hypothetical protein
MRSLDLAVDMYGECVASDAPAPLTGLAETQILGRGFHAFVHEMAGQPLGVHSVLPAMAVAPLAPYQRVMVLVCETLRATFSGEHGAAIASASRAIELDLGEQFEFFHSAAVCLLGSATIAVGRPAEGLKILERGIELYSALGVLTALPFYLSMRAEGHLAVGDLDAAVAAVEESMAALERSGERWNEPFVLCAAAAVERAAGAPLESVIEQMRHARDLALAQGAKGIADRIAERSLLHAIPID